MESTKTARVKNAGTKKNHARKGKSTIERKVTRATSSRDRYYRVLATSEPLSDEAYLRDEAILAKALSEFSLDERMAMDRYQVMAMAMSAGSPQFQAEVLPLACKAVRRRAERLHILLNDIRGFFELKLQDYYADLTPAERETSTAHVIACAEASYAGEVEEEPVINWVVRKMEQTVKIIRAIRTDAALEQQEQMKQHQHHIKVFGDIYSAAYSSAFAGVMEIMEDCSDLGASEEEARDVVQHTFMRIWAKIDEWDVPGTASIQTRVRAFARRQALGWRKKRIEEKTFLSLLKFSQRQDDLPYPRSAKKHNLTHYDDRDYDSKKL
jgi:hypothetical protein